MPLPSSSPKPSHYASPVKLETNSTGTASSPPPSSGKKERRHKKHHHHHSSGKQRSETPLTWKEQLSQVAAIFLTAVVVYKLTLTGVRWLEEIETRRRPFCDDLQDPVRDNCRPCPENGICRDGDFRCIPGFRRQGARCVPDKQIDRNAPNLAEFVQSKVCGISGESPCRSDVTTWVQEQQLWYASMEDDLGLDAESVWLVREKALQLVRVKLSIRLDDLGFELLP